MEHISEKVFKGVMLHSKTLLAGNVSRDPAVDKFLKKIRRMSNIKKTNVRRLEKLFPFFTICMFDDTV